MKCRITYSKNYVAKTRGFYRIETFENRAEEHPMSEEATITIQATMSESQAWAFAEFLKRVGLSDYKGLAVDADEAYLMLSAGECLRRELGEQGIAPR